MAFIRSRQRVAPRQRPVQVVLAVGQRVFIHRHDDPSRAVTLTDEHGTPAAAYLRDGAEVEIVAWRPRGATGTRYRVRHHSDGSDGWLAADELRTTAVRPAPVEPIAAPQSPSPSSGGYHGAGRPFGSRL